MQLQFSTSPLFGDPRLPERFWSKVRVAPSGCWEWTAKPNSEGYGLFSLNSRLLRAHRVAYEALVESFPDGLQSDHLCRIRNCVNPAHIEPVTCRENILRGVSPAATRARKTQCHNGHPFNTENTRISTRGERVCRACDRKRWRRRQAYVEDA